MLLVHSHTFPSIWRQPKALALCGRASTSTASSTLPTAPAIVPSVPKSSQPVVDEKPLKYSHNGTIKVSEGSLQVADGNIVGGNFTIDMNTIENQDLAEKPDKKADLENHLMSGESK